VAALAHMLPPHYPLFTHPAFTFPDQSLCHRLSWGFRTPKAYPVSRLCADLQFLTPAVHYQRQNVLSPFRHPQFCEQTHRAVSGTDSASYLTHITSFVSFPPLVLLPRKEEGPSSQTQKGPDPNPKSTTEYHLANTATCAS
jgi:hypothetical protein